MEKKDRGYETNFNYGTRITTFSCLYCWLKDKDKEYVTTSRKRILRHVKKHTKEVIQK